jgi:hypothetical protein
MRRPLLVIDDDSFAHRAYLALSTGRVLGALDSLRLHTSFRGGQTCLNNGFSEFLQETGL